MRFFNKCVLFESTRIAIGIALSSYATGSVPYQTFNLGVIEMSAPVIVEDLATFSELPSTSSVKMQS